MKSPFESYFREYLENRDIVSQTLREAMLYSYESGGKRIRPTVFFLLLEDLDANQPYLSFATALECIHTYSLIHDDLPAMDDDDYRRGKPTSHKVYGEAMAILAGDALLNEAMELCVAGTLAMEASLQPRGLLATKYLLACAGSEGMIDGQALDISEGAGSEDTILYGKKTGALFGAALAMAAILGTGDEALAQDFLAFGRAFGIYYQFQDDYLDLEEDWGDITEREKKQKALALRERESYIQRTIGEREKNYPKLTACLKEILKRKE